MSCYWPTPSNAQRRKTADQIMFAQSPASMAMLCWLRTLRSRSSSGNRAHTSRKFQFPKYLTPRAFPAFRMMMIFYLTVTARNSSMPMWKIENNERGQFLCARLRLHKIDWCREHTVHRKVAFISRLFSRQSFSAPSATERDGDAVLYHFCVYTPPPPPPQRDKIFSGPWERVKMLPLESRSSWFVVGCVQNAGQTLQCTYPRGFVTNGWVAITERKH